MGDPAVRQQRLEPTVLGAVLRYRAMVLAVVLATAAVAAGLAMAQTESFRAEATITVPQPVSQAGEPSDQYLASQVVLLRSPEVAARAARIADRVLREEVLTRSDFMGGQSSLEIIPPDMAQPGTYGANVVTVAFSWPDADVAQTGANSVLRAFDEVRSEAITTQGEATVAGVERAIHDTRTRGQLSALLNQRAKALVEEKLDLAQHPTVAWATKPRTPVNGNVKRSAAIGGLVGIVLGAALAYARAMRRRTFADEHEPTTLYDAPMLGSLPASAVGEAPRDVPTDEPVMAADPGSGEAEAFRFTAGSLQRIRSGRVKRMSLAFVSPGTDPARSSVVANLALALAEGGTRVLAVDGDASHARLTTSLVPGATDADASAAGLRQVLTGERTLTDCVVRSPLQERVAVLPPGDRARSTPRGTAYSMSLKQLLGKGKAGYEVVLVDSPALLEEAVATDVVDASDAAIVVMGPHEPVREHVEVLRRLELIDGTVVGYVYRQAARRSTLARLREMLQHGPSRPARAPGWLTRPLSLEPGTRR